MELEKNIVEGKLARLREYIDLLENFEVGEDEFLQNKDPQHLLVFRLTRCVELAIDIATHLVASMKLPRDETAAEVFQTLSEEEILSKSTSEAMSKAVGFRNLAVHEYDGVDFDLERIYRDYRKDVEDIKKFAKEVSEYLKSV